jgi:hypothetical protein
MVHVRQVFDQQERQRVKNHFSNYRKKKVINQCIKFFNPAKIFFEIFIIKTAIKKVTGIPKTKLFRPDGSCLQDYCIAGAATAAVAEALPKPSGA